MPRMSIGFFASQILGKPLYHYQIEVGDAILDSVLTGAGLTFTVMMSRQSGKNQLSAVLEAYLLFAFEQGTIVKASPTWLPQCVNSKMRLLSMLECPLLHKRIYKSYGYIVGLAQDETLVESQVGPRLMLFSASPEANVVGATASLLLEIDEAQDVDPAKFDRDFRPMASTTNATTVLYGTAFSDVTLLAQQQAHNAELEEQDGIRRNFVYDWRTLAAINSNYQSFVEAEIKRLGEDHPSIKTQYLLQPISGAGLLLNDLQKHLLQGSHSYLDTPDEDEDDSFYIAGLDVAGEQRAIPGKEGKSTKRDSTVLTIGRVSYNEFDLPRVDVVHHEWFTGLAYLDQYAAISELMQRWNIHRLSIDRTGLGDMLASVLVQKFGEDRVVPFQFTRPSKSKLTYQFLSMINSGRLKMYTSEYAPSPINEECWQQLKLSRYAIPGDNLITMFCADGVHDDFLISLALLCEATHDLAPPPTDSVIIKPRRMYGDGRF